LYDFNIREISIPNGKFTWINHTRKGKTTSFDNAFSATLKNFKLNEKELKKERLLFSDDFNISVKDQMFQLSDSVHVLKAGEINLSSERSSVQIRDALLYPLIHSKKYANLPTTFQVSIPEIQISNIDFLSAYYSKELRLNTFELNSPKFEIYTQKGHSGSLDLNKFQFPLPAFIKSLQLNELKINAAEVINYSLVGLTKSAQSNFMINLSLPNVSLKNNSLKQAHISSSNLFASIYDFRIPLGKNHELKLGRLNFDRSKKDIEIKQLEVNPFTSNKNDNRFSISVPRVYLSDFHIQNALKNSYFKFDEIEIIDPSIAIEINDSIKGDKLEFANNLDLYPFVKPYVNKIEVERVHFQNTDLNFNWFEKELINKQFNLDFKEIVIGENSKGNNLLNSKEFELSTSNIKSRSKNGFYEYSADSLVYNSAQHNTLLKNIQIKPLFSRDDFHRRIDYQSDYVSGSCEFLELKNIDENRWLKNNVIEAEKIVLGASDLSIFRNKRLPFNTAQRPPWPQDLLKELKQAFVFDSVIMQPSTLLYSELQDLTDQPGFIEFKQLSFRAGRLTNIPEVLSKNPFLQIKASCRLYDEGLLSINYTFNLQAGNYEHRVKGSLAPMSLLSFNHMIESSAPISIQSGQLNRFEFDIDFGENQSNGSLYLGYDDFKIAVLNRSQMGTKKSKLASFWANNLVLRSKSPKGEIGAPATIAYERDIQRSIINYWWKSLFTGTKETIGLKQKK